MNLIILLYFPLIINQSMEGNLIQETFTGTLYDGDFPDCLIRNNDELQRMLVANIAKEVPQYISKGKGKPEIKFVTNSHDAFLNELFKPNFNDQEIIAVRGCKIESITVNGENYYVQFGEPMEDQYYFAAIVKAPNPKPKDVIFSEERPSPFVSQRASLSRPIRFDEI